MSSDTPDQSGATGCKSRPGASMSNQISRRGLLVALAGGAGLAGLAASEAPTEPDSLGVGGQPGVLAIGPTESYQIPSGESEQYRAVNWADGGELELNGELTLVDQA